MLTPSRDLALWTNPDLEPIPPTFPYQPDDFKTEVEHDRAYTMMSHSIATKLCDFWHLLQDNSIYCSPS